MDPMGLIDEVKSAYVRRKYSRLRDLPHERFSVRLANSAEDLEAAFRLIHVGYAYLGIESVSQSPYRMTDQHILPESHVLCAVEDGMLVGTITLTLDSPAKLPLDHDYPEVERLRSPTRKLAEVGSFVVVKRCWNTGLAQYLAACAGRLAYSLFGVTDLVLGAHPKTLPYYRGIWGATVLGAPKSHASLNAPVISLLLQRDVLRAHVERTCAAATSTGYSIGDHLFDWQAPFPNTELEEDLILEGRVPSRVPRAVFQRLFIERTSHLQDISRETRDYLRTLRTEETLDAVPLRQEDLARVAAEGWPPNGPRDDDTIPFFQLAEN